MDAQELDTNIGELEEKLDRLRALYEQYFCGIEKLEPQVPRKDLDRRIMLLRKEQIRNTAQRFKFNTIVQRYNTMQQHWHRVLREIENGTYKRDLARAAARFGVDDALTAVGKKRAASMVAGLKAQLERQGRRQGKQAADEYEDVDDLDVQSVDEFDDDAPTPPPVQGEDGAQQPHAAHQQQAQWAQHQQQAQYQQQQQWSQQQYDAYYAQQQQQYAAAYAQHYAQQQQAWGQAASAHPQGYDQQQYYQQQHHQQQAHEPPPGQVANSPQQSNQPSQAEWQAQQQAAAQDAQQNAAAARERKAGGLRLGGGPSRKASAEALNRIASTLGADARSQPATDEGRKPLLSSPLGLDLPEPEPHEPPAPASARRPPQQQSAAPPSPMTAEKLHVEPAPQPRTDNKPPIEKVATEMAPPEPHSAPGADKPVAKLQAPPPRAAQPATAKLAPPPARASTPGFTPGASPVADSKSSVAKEKPPSQRPAAAATASVSAPPPSGRSAPTESAVPRADVADAKRGASALRSPGKPKEDLSEGRLREIYSQYVQTRRDRNESTAGITFEKLADSLRSQAEKLKSKHASKRVDYEVVVKDGKTLIEPIVK